MVSILALWLPILLSAVLVFIASSIIHMVLTYHRKDFRGLPAEDEIMAALRGHDIPPGEYVMPYASSPKELGDATYQEKAKRGPVAFMTVMPSGVPTMGKSLVLWFIYCVVVGIFTAYIAGRCLGPGALYLDVFQIAGCVAFIGYALALWQNSIWYKRAWSITLKNTFDGLIYGLLTGGTFGWLWPG